MRAKINTSGQSPYKVEWISESETVKYPKTNLSDDEKIVEDKDWNTEKRRNILNITNLTEKERVFLAYDTDSNEFVSIIETIEQTEDNN